MRPVTRFTASGLGMRLPRSAYSAMLCLPYAYTVRCRFLRVLLGVWCRGYRNTPALGLSTGGMVGDVGQSWDEPKETTGAAVTLASHTANHQWYGHAGRQRFRIV